MRDFSGEPVWGENDHTWLIGHIVQGSLGECSLSDQEMDNVQSVLENAYSSIRSHHHFASEEKKFLEDFRLLVIPVSSGKVKVVVIDSRPFSASQYSSANKALYESQVDTGVSEETFLREFLQGFLLALKDVLQQEVYRAVASRRDSIAEIIQIQKYWPGSRDFANHLLGESLYYVNGDQAPLSAAVNNFAKELMSVAHDKLDGMEQALHLFLSRFMLNALLGMTSVVSCRVSQHGEGKGMMIDQYGKVLFVDYQGGSAVPREYSLYEPVNYSAQMPLRLLEALSIFFRDHLTKPYSDVLLQAQEA